MFSADMVSDLYASLERLKKLYFYILRVKGTFLSSPLKNVCTLRFGVQPVHQILENFLHKFHQNRLSHILQHFKFCFVQNMD